MSRACSYEMKPKASGHNIVSGEHYRITILTERLFRFEYSESGVFEDRASQVVWFRDLGDVEYTVSRMNDVLEIRTAYVVIRYDQQKFSAAGLSARYVSSKVNDAGWFYGREEPNLRGTARTLDNADGSIPLDKGVVSMDGYTVLDDSQSVLLTEEDWLAERIPGNEDFYLFAYNKEYEEAVKAFFQISGKTPMLPRYALGNWWSRYYEYSADSYRELMKQFDKEKIPFSVAVIDMDWHLVNIDPKYGTGWTGYTWNKELFPEPEKFMDWLHDRGMKVTLNVHPASGIRAHEEMYPAVAQAMGIDPAGEEPVEFDFTNPQFIKAYFELVHHPLEEQGVDFWWLDWQQGSHTKIQGLDPLWMLNHYHYRDNGRDGKRPMTFSRYAGPGAHRYPVGFSGDTYITWESLQFQPYFTYTASNIGYGWWSHDIGGHMLGYKSDVLEARWYQFGVFSPISRLHSSKCEFSCKEPWHFRSEVREAMGQILRLRHKLIPYLYTMNYLCYSQGRQLVRPMYYDYPECEDAFPMKIFYRGGNREQYLFGTDMIVAPITTDNIPALNRGKVNVWIPKGVYHDFFTGIIYRGDRLMSLYRDIYSIPVLVKAGGIIPLTEEIFGQNAMQNPKSLEIRVYGGADGTFTLYEDDNTTEGYRDGDCVQTQMTFNWEKGTFILKAAEGSTVLIPEKRSYTISFMGVEKAVPEVYVDGSPVACCRWEEVTDDCCKAEKAAVGYDKQMHSVKIMISDISVTSQVEIQFKTLTLAENDRKKHVFDILDFAQVEYHKKELVYQAVKDYKDTAKAISFMRGIGLDADVAGAVEEILTADMR